MKREVGKGSCSLSTIKQGGLIALLFGDENFVKEFEETLHSPVQLE